MKDFIIFLLDDDKKLCELMAVLVKHAVFMSKLPGYNIILYTYYDTKDLKEAILQIEKIRPDLLLLDYMLGTQTGACLDSLAVLNEIIPYCLDIQIVSGLYIGDVRLKLIQGLLGRMHIDILQKPFNTSELVSAIKNSIRKKEDVKHN
jgi:DNA-binding response OmpR family regulator